jgi:hypothetical protein
MNFSKELDDEILEEFVYEYEDEIEEIDVDEIIADLKADISEYIYDNPFDEVPDMDFDEIDYDFVDDYQIPDEELERLEPNDVIFDDLEK